MPSWETHREIAEMFGIDRNVCNGVDKIIDSEGKNEVQWEGVKDYIKIKKLEYLTDDGSEVKEIIKEHFWHHDCRRDDVPCFFIKAQTAYDNFGDDGLKAYFLHHALDIAHYFRCPKYFGIEVETPSKLTRSQVQERFNWTVYGFSRKGICLYELRDYVLTLNPASVVCYHVLTNDVFLIEEEHKPLDATYKFNDRVKELVEDVKWFLQDNFSVILEMIYNNDCKKGRLGEL